MEFIRDIKGAPAPVGAYSPAVRVGDMLYCAGQVGLDPDSGALENGLEAQTKRVFQNLSAVLKAAGTSAENIAMTTIFLADIQDAKIVNEIYSDFVSGERLPARQTVAVKDLPLGALVEVSLIAAIPS